MRGASLYRIYRQHSKKWRVPFTMVLALLFVFTMAPIVGDNLQTSVLTADQNTQIQQADKEQAKKIVLNALDEFSRECDRFSMKECVEKTKLGISEVVKAEDVNQMLAIVTQLEDMFDQEVARKACVFDLGAAVSKGIGAQNAMKGFFEKYGENFDDNASAYAYLNQFDKSLADLDAFVHSCVAR